VQWLLYYAQDAHKNENPFALNGNTEKGSQRSRNSSPFWGNIILCKISYFTVETHKIRRHSFVDAMSWWPTNGKRPANCISCCLTTLKAINLQ